VSKFVKFHGRTVKTLNRMETKSRSYRSLFGNEEGLIGLLLVNDSASLLPKDEEVFPFVLLVCDRDLTLHEELEYWLRDKREIRVRRVTPETLDRWILTGDRNGIRWLLRGKVLLDHTGQIGAYRRKLKEWPILLREQKLLYEFSRFILACLHAKRALHDGQILDAYSHLLSSLHYWANVALVEQGLLPERSVWEQMRTVNPGIYKLFEELTSSPETLEQRVQLVIMACEFSMLTNMQSGCALLLQIIGSRTEPWTVAELQQDYRLHGVDIDLPLLLKKLVQRGLVKEEVQTAAMRGAVRLDKRYSLASERLR